MAVLPFLLVPPPSAASVYSSPRCLEDAKLSCVESNKVSILTVKRFSRRIVLQFLGINHMIWYASPALAAPIMPDMKEPEVMRTLKLPSGVRIQDIVEGEGPEAYNGDVVKFNCVCRRANGYFVFSRSIQWRKYTCYTSLGREPDDSGLKRGPHWHESWWKEKSIDPTFSRIYK